MMTEDEIAQAVAQFVLNHEQHILDNVSDFGLLLPMLEVLLKYAIKDSLDNEPISEEYEKEADKVFGELI